MFILSCGFFHTRLHFWPIAPFVSVCFFVFSPPNLQYLHITPINTVLSVCFTPGTPEHVLHRSQGGEMSKLLREKNKRHETYFKSCDKYPHQTWHNEAGGKSCKLESLRWRFGCDGQSKAGRKCAFVTLSEVAVCGQKIQLNQNKVGDSWKLWLVVFQDFTKHRNL